MEDEAREGTSSSLRQSSNDFTIKLEPADHGMETNMKTETDFKRHGHVGSSNYSHKSFPTVHMLQKQSSLSQDHLQLANSPKALQDGECSQARAESGGRSDQCASSWDDTKEGTHEAEDDSRRRQTEANHESDTGHQLPASPPHTHLPAHVKSEPYDHHWDQTDEKTAELDGSAFGTSGVQPVSMFPNAPFTSDSLAQVGQTPYSPFALYTSTGQRPAGGELNKRTRTAPKGRTEERPHECEVCQAAFTQAVYLKRHRRTHSDERPWKCEECGKAFIRRSQLQVHARSHSGEKPYKCPHCDASFSQTGHLQVHKRTHTGEKPFICKECGSTFSATSHLSLHVRSVHTNHRPFECLVCGMGFTTPANLRIHCRTHSGEKPYKCDQCDAAFTQSSNLRQHQARHTWAKPHTCQLCDMKFPSHVLLQRHFKAHDQETSLACSTCDETFPTALLLHNHVRKNHRVPKFYSCQFCMATFTQSCNLKRHLLTHSGVKPFPCSHCDAAFTQLPHLQRHLKSIHGSTLEEDRPFKCPECPAAFARVSDLKRHSKKHTMGFVATRERAQTMCGGTEVLIQEEDPQLWSAAILSATEALSPRKKDSGFVEDEKNSTCEQDEIMKSVEDDYDSTYEEDEIMKSVGNDENSSCEQDENIKSVENDEDSTCEQDENIKSVENDENSTCEQGAAVKVAQSID